LYLADVLAHNKANIAFKITTSPTPSPSLAQIITIVVLSIFTTITTNTPNFNYESQPNPTA
jgi:hypothetical protein